MKKQSNFEAIYHELSARHGQLMSSKQVCDELGVSRVCYAKKLIPSGWMGNTRGLYIKTVVFARQLAELSQ